MISMVVFDMAGTTVNEGNVVYKTLQQAINNRGYHFSLEQVMAEGAGKEKREAIKGILKAYAKIYSENLVDGTYDEFIILLDEAYKQMAIEPQPNAEELFQVLKQKDIKVVLNTGYDADTAESLVEKLGWEKGQQFDSLISSSDVENNRPDPEMIELAMDIHGIHNAWEVIKVGDSIIDIEEGQNAGCRLSIGITTGAHNFSQLQSANPDYIIGNLMELVPIIDKVNSQPQVP